MLSVVTAQISAWSPGCGLIRVPPVHLSGQVCEYLGGPNITGDIFHLKGTGKPENVTRTTIQRMKAAGNITGLSPNVTKPHTEPQGRHQIVKWSRPYNELLTEVYTEIDTIAHPAPPPPISSRRGYMWRKQ